MVSFVMDGLLLQLRGLSQKRQVPGAMIGLQHNFGIGGAAIVTLYKKYHKEVISKLWDSKIKVV